MNNRLEELGNSLIELQRQYSSGAVTPVDQLFLSICQTCASAATDVEIAAIAGMGLLVEAIFTRIARGEATGIFSSEALREYSLKCGVPVDMPQVQNMVDRLIAANLLMRTGHGFYDVTDPFVRDAWMAAERHRIFLNDVQSG